MNFKKFMDIDFQKIYGPWFSQEDDFKKFGEVCIDFFYRFSVIFWFFDFLKLGKTPAELKNIYFFLFKVYYL
jgi:hypothetical protein